MPTTKVCAQCFAAVNIRKSACGCGYSFVKGKTSAKSEKLAKRLKRAAEPLSETKMRQCADKVRRAQRRALETEDETLYRRRSDRACTARKRACETESDTLQRRERDRACTAIKRASKRASCIPIDKAISAFHSKVNIGPEYVCTCCHRMMYKQTVVPCNKTSMVKLV